MYRYSVDIYTIKCNLMVIYVILCLGTFLIWYYIGIRIYAYHLFIVYAYIHTYTYIKKIIYITINKRKKIGYVYRFFSILSQIITRADTYRYNRYIYIYKYKIKSIRTGYRTYRCSPLVSLYAQHGVILLLYTYYKFERNDRSSYSINDCKTEL